MPRPTRARVAHWLRGSARPIGRGARRRIRAARRLATLPKTRKKKHPEHDLADGEGLEDFSARHRRDTLWKLAAHWLQRHEVVDIEVLVQSQTSALCWLRSRANDYTPAEDDIFVLPSIVERFGLLEGMTVKGRLLSGALLLERGAVTVAVEARRK